MSPKTISLNTPETGYENRRIIDGKTFHVLSDEVEISATVDAVWSEVAENFVGGADIAESLSASSSIGTAPTQGLGAERPWRPVGPDLAHRRIRLQIMAQLIVRYQWRFAVDWQ